RRPSKSEVPPGKAFPRMAVGLPYHHYRHKSQPKPSRSRPLIRCCFSFSSFFEPINCFMNALTFKATFSYKRTDIIDERHSQDGMGGEKPFPLPFPLWEFFPGSGQVSKYGPGVDG